MLLDWELTSFWVLYGLFFFVSGVCILIYYAFVTHVDAYHTKYQKFFHVFIIVLDLIKDLLYVIFFPHINSLAVIILWVSIIFPATLVQVFPRFGSDEFSFFTTFKIIIGWENFAKEGKHPEILDDAICILSIRISSGDKSFGSCASIESKKSGFSS